MSGAAGVAGEDPARGGRAGSAPLRVLISYAHDDRAHVERVREFWLFLRAYGIDARLDLSAAGRRQDWPQWMTRQVRDADRIVVVASPEYRRRAEGDAGPAEGRGVQWEARLIRNRFYADQDAGVQLVLPVVLPGCSAVGLPLWLAPASATHYVVSSCTVAGAEALLRVLTGQPWEIEPGLGAVPYLPPRGAGSVAGLARPVLHTQVLIEVSACGDRQVASAVWLGESLVCQRQAPLPAQVAGVWGALELPPLAAAGRVADVGRRLAGVLFDDAAQRLLAGMVDRLPPGDTMEVVLSAAGPLLSLPVELIRLATEAGGEVGPLGLAPAVSVCRRPAAAARGGGETPAPDEALGAPAGLPGPLKVLAAVAAPDETKTQNAPLDVEAEMQAVLDAVGGMPGGLAQVQTLEVASLAQIRRALERDVFHVLHLSAHGSATSVELEDEDGNPVSVTARSLMQALRQAGRPVPLIVLSSWGSASHAIASGLVERGADRVIAMLAPVTDGYGTVLARRLYQELARPGSTAGQALTRARILAEEDRSHREKDRVPPLPEYGVATLLAAGGDGPLVDPAAPPVPLTVATEPAGGRSVRELPVGVLIGRRVQLRTAMGVLRRDPGAVRDFGAASGVVLTGIGGIGKTAVAGRVTSRLREDGWLIAVHEGQWNRAALIAAIAGAINAAAPRVTDPVLAAALARAGALLTDPGYDDGPNLAAVTDLLESRRVLVVFDDFEQNLTPGGQEFLDPATGEVMTILADAAQAGALLVTCRYPLPGPDRFLVDVPVPALSAAELRRMFLRLPALAGLDPADQRLLIRTIGGHPRLIEFTDALLRGGRSTLRHVQVKLRELAHKQDVDLRQDRPLPQAMDQAMVLGSADILLAELLALLTPRQAAVLAQVAVCRAPMTLDDLAFTFSPGADPASTGPAPADGPPGLAELQADTARLAELTLVAPGPDIAMHPWTAAMVARHTSSDSAVLHQRALAMRFRRFERQRGSYDDQLDIPRHLAALLTPDAEHLFNLCAFFSPEPIAAELFLQYTAGIDYPPGLGEFLSSPHRFRAAESKLHRVPRVKVDGARDLIQMHRVVQAATQDRLRQDHPDMFIAYSAAVDTLLASSNPGNPDHSSNDAIYDLSLQHLKSDHRFLHTNNPALRGLIINQVRRLRLRGAHLEALQFGQEALRIWRERYGQDDLQVLTMAVEVAVAMYIGGRAADAHELILQIRPLVQRYTDGYGIEVFLLCEVLYSEDLRAHSQFREALELDLSILPKFETAFGVDHERTMNVRNNLAIDYLRLGRSREALEVDQRNLEDRRRVLGPSDMITLNSYSAVARDLRSLGFYQESLDIARKAAKAFEAIDGRENPFWLDACDGFATALRKAGHHRDALQESEQVLHRYRDYLGDDHMHTLRAAANLVNARRAVGDLVGAEELARETHEACQRSNGPEDLLYAVLVNLASVLRVANHPDEARAYDEQARRGLIRIYGDLHPFTLVANINYASDLAGCGKLGEAIHVGNETLAKCRQSLGGNHPDTLIAEANLAIDEAAAGNQAHAEQRLADVLRRYKETLTPEHPEARAAANWTRLTAEIEPYI